MKQILPGSTIGVLGSGQLGRMFAIAARRMGYRVHTVFARPRFSDLVRLRISKSTLPMRISTACARSPRPSMSLHSSLRMCPRLRPTQPPNARWCGQRAKCCTLRSIACARKTFLARHGFPVTRFEPIRTAEDLARVVPGFGPAILKTAGFGYDGKGQYRVNSLDEASFALPGIRWAGRRPCWKRWSISRRRFRWSEFGTPPAAARSTHRR